MGPMTEASAVMTPADGETVRMRWKGEGKEVMDEDGKERAEPFSRETGLGAKV